MKATLIVDEVLGVDRFAPGLHRAETRLIQSLGGNREFQFRRLEHSNPSTPSLFAYLYGVLPAQLLMHRSDMVHIASSWYAHVVPLLDKPTVVTCHDLIQVPGAPGERRLLKPHRRFQALAAFRGLRRADAIVCDSRAVADQLIELAPETSSRVRVIHLGADERFSPGDPDWKRLDEVGVASPYLLYVGSEQRRKNLSVLVDAFAIARRTIPDLQFVKVGSHQTAAGREMLIARLKEKNVLHYTKILDHVPEELLIDLYRGAAATVLVSTEEGFGFPPIEAMSSGCPVVISNVEPLPEIAGGAALVVDPRDSHGIAEAVVSSTIDGALRDRLILSGVERAKHFRWDGVARAYAEVFRSVTGR